MPRPNNTDREIDTLKTAMRDRLVEIGWASAVVTRPVVDGIDLGGISQAGMEAARDDRSGQHGWARDQLSRIGQTVASEMLRAHGVGVMPTGPAAVGWIRDALRLLGAKGV